MEEAPIILKPSTGFTLIELLVVIAIIAVLAAILFPVFAQAKIAAKKTAAISNAKQLTLGVLMYTNDVDDQAPAGTAWAPPSSTGNYPLEDNGWAGTWAWVILPYVKNTSVYFDPLAPTTEPQPFGGSGIPDQVLTATTFPNFGYNYTYMSPWGPYPYGSQVYGIEVGISMTSPTNSAQRIMLAERGSAPEETPVPYAVEEFGGSWLNAPPIENAVIEPPNCVDISAVARCVDNWGLGDYDQGASGYESTFESGSQTGGVAIRVANQSIVTFLDGHVKALNISFLAAGTNWSRTILDSQLTWQGDYLNLYMWGVHGQS